MNTENLAYCQRIANTLENENFNLFDYIENDVLDIQYIINSNRELKDVRLFVTLGGPTVWIDTESCSVKLAWGTESAAYGLDWDVCDMIRDEIEQLYNC